MGVDTITTEDVKQLQQALAVAELSIERPESSPDNLPLLIERFGHVKVEMYQERGPHKRPHFHIEFKGQYRASYAIDTLERIVGYMPRRYEAPVLEWAGSMQQQLFSNWNRLAAGSEPLQIEVQASTSR